MYLIFSCTVWSSRPLYGWMWKATFKRGGGGRGGYFQHSPIRSLFPLTSQIIPELLQRTFCALQVNGLGGPLCDTRGQPAQRCRSGK